MTTVTIDRVSRSFGSVQAVREVSLEIRDGEFFTLLGPSGCGKTTLLRMIAGFEQLDGFDRIRRRRIDTLPAHRRNTGMVFQNYAFSQSPWAARRHGRTTAQGAGRSPSASPMR